MSQINNKELIETLVKLTPEKSKVILSTSEGKRVISVSLAQINDDALVKWLDESQTLVVGR